MKKLGILMAMFFALAIVVPAWAQPYVSFNPEYAQRNLDGRVRMHIILSEATDLLSMGIKISFDPTKLQVDKNYTSKNNSIWQFTDLLPDTLAYAPDIAIDNDNGTVMMIGGRLQPGITGFDVLLGWVTFVCIAGDGHTTNVPINLQFVNPNNPPPPPSYDNFVREDGYVVDPDMNIGNTAIQLGTICIVDTSVDSTEACEGDLDHDGKVKRSDSAIFKPAYGSSFPDSGYDPAADLDADGKIKRSDSTIFKADYGRTTDCPCNF